MSGRTWREGYAELISIQAESWPDSMPLKERIKAVDALRPKSSEMSCSWPQKAWQAARRDYLIPFGYQPKTKKAAERKASAIGDLPLFSDGETHGR